MVLLLLLTSLSSSAQTLSMTVGKVSDHIITSREVHLQAMMEKALYQSVKLDALKIDPLDSKTFFAEVNDTILERALATEAKSFDVVHLDEKEVREMEGRVARGLATTTPWKSIDPQPAEWKGLLERKLKAKQFIRFRKESSELPITDIEAKRYFEENRLKFGNLPFDNFRENIKSFLARSQVDRRLKDWYEVIKAKYNAKNFLAEL